VTTFSRLINHFARVGGQFGLIGIFEGVLKLRAADAVFDSEVLKRLQEELNALDTSEARLHAANHFSRGDFADFERLEVDLDAAGVESRVGSVDANKGRDVVDCMILQQNIDELLLALGHAHEADGLGSFADAEDDAGVLHGEKSLGNHEEKKNGSHQRGYCDEERGEAVTKDHLDGTAVRGNDGVENTL
jgi:hypothetical protein